jgi:excisionase family DNA binding protein
MEKQYLSVDELAAYLGISKYTVYWWTATRRIPHKKLGKLVRFDLDEIKLWIQSKDRR